MTEQEYTPSEARLRERVKGSLGEYAHEFGIDGEAAMDEWIDRALAERDNQVRADERAKRPDREQIAKALFEVRDDPYDDDEWEDLDAQQRERWECDADAVLALEPETREVTDAEIEAAWASLSRSSHRWPDISDMRAALEAAREVSRG